MTQLMEAICIVPNEGVKIKKVPRPEDPPAEHLIIRMNSSAINPGDQAFVNRPLPPGSVNSLYNVYGASGVGQVIAAGEGVPDHYLRKYVTMYRSLRYSSTMIGAWSEYTQMHFLDCAVLPDTENPESYSGSLVNMITPYAFYKQAFAEGHKGIISTAGSSATGIAMLGMSIAYKFPLISLVRNQNSKKKLEELGATHVIVDDNKLVPGLRELSSQIQATAVFDGVGGSILNKIIEALPNNSTIYSYGYLGDDPLNVQMRTLTAKGISIKPFGNIRTATVQNPENLKNALKEIADIIHMPHFKTPVGKKFRLSEIEEALIYKSENGGKAVLTHLF